MNERTSEIEKAFISVAQRVADIERVLNHNGMPQKTGGQDVRSGPNQQGTGMHRRDDYDWSGQGRGKGGFNGPGLCGNTGSFGFANMSEQLRNIGQSNMHEANG